MDFKDPDSLNKAYELNGTDLGGYSLYLDEAKPRPDNNRDGGFSGGRGSRGGRSDKVRGGGRGRGFGGRGGQGSTGEGMFGLPYIWFVRFLFLAGTVFFSHNISARTVFFS